MKIAWLSDNDPHDYLGGAEISDSMIIEEIHKRDNDDTLTIVLPEMFNNFYAQRDCFDVVVLSNMMCFDPRKLVELENIILYVHDDLATRFPNGVPDGYKDIVKKARAGCYYGDLHYQHCVDMGAATKNRFFITQPIDMEWFKMMNLNREDRGVCISNIHRHKNLEKTVAWAHDNNTIVDFYGTCTDETYLSELIDNKHTFYKGIVANVRIPFILNRYYKFIHFPEYNMQTSRTLLEAHYCGCEIITTPRYSTSNNMYPSREEMRKQPKKFWDGVRKHVGEING